MRDGSTDSNIEKHFLYINSLIKTLMLVVLKVFFFFNYFKIVWFVYMRVWLYFREFFFLVKKTFVSETFYTF